MRIAMWSGPRNLSTAMMYAFGNRADCAAWDEPFYGAYLKETGLDHPLREDILELWPTTVEGVVSRCIGSIPGNKPIFYQKHMTHHIQPGHDLVWTRGFQNVFLIRHPARVIASYLAKRESPTADDLGFRRQAEVFDEIRDLAGRNPVVVDAADIRADPKTMLSKLCAAVGVPFNEEMIRWSAGPKTFDGPWAPHWYDAVHQSTGFAGEEGPLPSVPPDYAGILEESVSIYHKLAGLRLT